MIQIIHRLLYVAILEFVELAIVYRRTRQLEQTANALRKTINRQPDDLRWN